MPKKKDKDDLVIELPDEITMPEAKKDIVVEEEDEAVMEKPEIKKSFRKPNKRKKYICIVPHFDSSLAMYRNLGYVTGTVPENCENYYRKM